MVLTEGGSGHVTALEEGGTEVVPQEVVDVHDKPRLG